MYSEILNLIKTKEDQNDLLMSLRELVLELEQPNKTTAELLNKFIPVKYISGINIENVNQNPKEFFLNLISEIEKLAIVKLEIGFDPTQDFIDTLYVWFDNNIHEHVVLEVNTNPSIILGAKIGFKGKFFDGTNHATK